MSKTWLITGASSGFGRLLAERVAAEGDNVIAIARRGDRLRELAATANGRITPVVLDLTSSNTESTVADVIRYAGGLDVLVNNAGFGLIGSVEQCDDADVRKQFDVNVFAALTVMRAALPALRTSKGRIVQVLSFFSELAVPGSGLYSASKAALQLISEALSLEIAPTGIRVTTIHPGHFSTEFKESAHVVEPDEIYESTVGATISHVNTMPADAWADPQLVVDAILAVSSHPQPPRRLAIGDDAVESIRNALQTQLEGLVEWEPLRGMTF